MKAKVLVNLFALRSPWISTTSPMVRTILLTTDGTHHTIRHQHLQVSLLRSSLSGSLIRIQMQRKAMQSSVGMSSNKPNEPAPSKPTVPEIVPSNVGSHQSVYSCLTRTRKFLRTLTKTSRPHEMALLLG